ncbi:hypothetical protein APL35_gp142 [Apis mellifera filamentous virus]|uniref:hypothetical protein n=1 Tax=Apis mellifera filamentous virus TaxID=1100043 RepID=UPI0006BD876F|nr:hypothetical protein APL35_gp142 [Apis mellifera filamentous virus]
MEGSNPSRRDERTRTPSEKPERLTTQLLAPLSRQLVPRHIRAHTNEHHREPTGATTRTKHYRPVAHGVPNASDHERSFTSLIVDTTPQQHTSSNSSSNSNSNTNNNTNNNTSSNTSSNTNRNTNSKTQAATQEMQLGTYDTTKNTTPIQEQQNYSKQYEKKKTINKKRN